MSSHENIKIEPDTPIEISQGGFGIVYKYDESAAIKTINRSKLAQNLVEILLMNLSRENSIQTSSKIIYSDTHIGIVQDLALCDMSRFFHMNPTMRKQRTSIVTNFLYDTIIGLNYLHCSNIILGDIKTNNLLIFRSELRFY